jgi:HAD superfamily hydrolase (TIGR01509 family)
VGARLVIFDCDGVLVDSEPAAHREFVAALAELGLEPRSDDADAFVGLSMTRSVEIIEERLGGAVPDDFVARLKERTFRAFRAGLRPVPGVREALDRIPWPYCVASSGEHEKMRLTLGLTGLLPRFEGRMFSATEVKRGKPHPDLFLHAARTLGAAPRDCTVVEDSVPGVRGAVAAGMRVLGYSARTDAGRLTAAGATPFADMARLPTLVAEAATG